MAPRTATIVTMLVGLAVAVSGCTDGDGKKDAAPPVVADPPSDSNNTTLIGPFDAPAWAVGHWWAHHTSLSADDPGEHFNVFVIAADGGGYEVATSSEELALREATQDVFDVGAFGADLSTTRGGAPWMWYSWPLEHNTTWTQTVQVGGVGYEATFTARYEPAVTLTTGSREGLLITAVTPDNVTILTYDYVEEVGWFTNLDLYDPAGDPNTPVFKIRGMGSGTERSDEYVQYEVSDLFSYTNAVNGSAPEGDLTATFTVPERLGKITGAAAVGSETGFATLRLVDPDGAVHEWTADAPGEVVVADVEIKDPTAGEWRLAFVGAAAAAWTAITLDGVTETRGSI